MTMIPRAAPFGLASRAASTGLCVLLLSACPDGYPTEDVPQIEPSRMTQAQQVRCGNPVVPAA